MNFNISKVASAFFLPNEVISCVYKGERSKYDKKYSWEEQCRALLQKMLTMFSGINFIQLTLSIRSLSMVTNFNQLLELCHLVFSFEFKTSHQRTLHYFLRGNVH